MGEWVLRNAAWPHCVRALAIPRYTPPKYIYVPNLMIDRFGEGGGVLAGAAGWGGGGCREEQTCHECPAGELRFAQNQPRTSVPLGKIRPWHI